MLGLDIFCDGFIFCNYKSVSTLVSYFVTDITLPLQTIVGIYQVHLLVNSYAELGEDIEPPRRFGLFSLVAISSIGGFSISIKGIIEFKNRYAIPYFLLLLCHYPIMFAGNLFVGSKIAQLCRKIQECAEVEALENIKLIYSPIVSEYEKFKSLLGYFIFNVFLFDSLRLTMISYFMLVGKDVEIVITIVYLVLHLCYYAFILEDYYSELKSTLPRLR